MVDVRRGHVACVSASSASLRFIRHAGRLLVHRTCIRTACMISEAAPCSFPVLCRIAALQLYPCTVPESAARCVRAGKTQRRLPPLPSFPRSSRDALSSCCWARVYTGQRDAAEHAAHRHQESNRHVEADRKWHETSRVVNDIANANHLSR